MNFVVPSGLTALVSSGTPLIACLNLSVMTLTASFNSSSSIPASSMKELTLSLDFTLLTSSLVMPYPGNSSL